MKNGDVLIVKGQDVSQIGETEKMDELFRAFSGNVPKSESEKKVIGRNEFREERNKRLGEWISGTTT